MDRCHSCNLAMGPHIGSRSWHSRDPESSSSEGEGHLRKTGTDWGLAALGGELGSEIPAQSPLLEGAPTRVLWKASKVLVWRRTFKMERQACSSHPCIFLMVGGAEDLVLSSELRCFPA